MENELSNNEQQRTIYSDLIQRDISRCNDYKCPKGVFCARFRQLQFDIQNGNTQMSVVNFKWSQKMGLCGYFISADA